MSSLILRSYQQYATHDLKHFKDSALRKIQRERGSKSVGNRSTAGTNSTYKEGMPEKIAETSQFNVGLPSTVQQLGDLIAQIQQKLSKSKSKYSPSESGCTAKNELIQGRGSPNKNQAVHDPKYKQKMFEICEENPEGYLKTCRNRIQANKSKKKKFNLAEFKNKLNYTMASRVSLK